MKIAILGAGMVGSAIAIDLSTQFEISSFDINEKNLAALKIHPAITCIKYDLSLFNTYAELLANFDFVVSAVPGFMGYKTLQAIIEAGKDVVDISFFPENALDLDVLARKKNVTAIVDCGVAPGMSNIILGYHDSLMKIDSFECLVGGLPIKRVMPFEYKAPFSPADVIEEYTRPARYVENGHIITKPAMSDTELIDFENVGTLESFNTDGLRSILFTMSHIPDMKEKTLRYPGHIDLMQALLKAGFFGHEELTIKGQRIKPIDFTSALLFDKWKLEPEEKEFTLMQIIIKGKSGSGAIEITYLLYDEYNSATKTSSMARTTGYTCNAVVSLLSKKLFTKKGVFPPEILGKENGCFDYILNYLSDRNIFYKKTVLDDL